MPLSNQVYLLDNNQPLSQKLEVFLEKKGYKTEHFKYGKRLLKRAKVIENVVIICNYKVKDMDGAEFLALFRKQNRKTPVIFISDFSEIPFVVKCMRRGAFDYVTTPVQPEEVLLTLKRAFLKLNPEQKSTTNQTDHFKNLVVGESENALQVEKHINLVSNTDFSILVEGETGTGKEVVARKIHLNSIRNKGPFVALDCGAIPEELAASELFGHVKGSFTGAIENKIGCFEAAHNGTLFLDEIGNLSFDNQLKLLRVLQERKIKPLGSNRLKKVNIRLIAATNDNLKTKVADGEFREDLYYRINEFKIELAPISERKKDLLKFASFFLENTNNELQKNIKGFSKSAINLIKEHAWPGNLRELKNAIKRATLLCQGNIIEESHLPISISETTKKPNFSDLNLKKALQKTEIQLIKLALQKTHFNKTKTAEILGIDRKTLYNKLDIYKLD